MLINEQIVNFIKTLYPNKDLVLLHCPEFLGNEKKYLTECIDTKFVSYLGHFVADMENMIKSITGCSYAVAMVNGTSALHMTFLSSGVSPNDEIITQSLTFAATSAAILHAQAIPVFVDVDIDTLGMSPISLRKFLETNAESKNGFCYNKNTGRKIKAVVPVHIFGHPVRIDEIKKICDDFSLMLIEDSAESLGSYYKEKHTGTFGTASIFSFNGNKLVTTGGGGMLITDDETIALRARYITTTAKRPHAWNFFHEEVGYNLRMPSLNAAIGLAQLEYFDEIIKNKRETAKLYQDFFESINIKCIKEPENCKSNYWLNTILLDNREQREEFLSYTNSHNVQTRPVWTLLHKMPPYKEFQKTEMTNSEWLEDRIVNIPSSVRSKN